jgi:hypothetical protein
VKTLPPEKVPQNGEFEERVTFESFAPYVCGLRRGCRMRRPFNAGRNGSAFTVSYY